MNRNDVMTALSFSVESDFEIGLMESLYNESLMNSEDAHCALESYISRKNDDVSSSLESMLSFLAIESDCEEKCKKECKEDEDEDDKKTEDEDDEEDEDAEEATLRAACEAADRNVVQKGVALVKTIIAKFKQFLTTITSNLANMVRKFNVALTSRRVKNDIKVPTSVHKMLEKMPDIERWAANIAKGIGGADAQEAKALANQYNDLTKDEETNKESGVVMSPEDVKKGMKDLSNLIKICNNAVKAAEAKVAKASGQNDLAEFGASTIRDSISALTKAVNAAFRSMMSVVRAAVKNDNTAKDGMIEENK